MSEKSVNKVLLLGRIGRDPEARYTPNGKLVVNFSMATNRSWKGADGERQEATDWHNIVLWGANNLVEYLKKGTKILVEGRLQTRSWEGEDGKKNYRTEVVVQAMDVVLLGSKSDGKSAETGPESHGADPMETAPTDGEEIQF